MLGSIAGCVVSIAYLVATTELDVDTSKQFRTNWSKVHGYFPASNMMQGVVITGIVLFVGGYLGTKLVALTILASTSPVGAVGWCAAEVVALWLLRYFAEGRVWRFHIRGLSGAVPSLILHLVIYLGMLAAPFPMLRYIYI